MAKKLSEESLDAVSGGYGNYKAKSDIPNEEGYWYVCRYNLMYKTVDAKGGYDTAAQRDYALEVTIKGAQMAGATNITYETGYNVGGD